MPRTRRSATMRNHTLRSATPAHHAARRPHGRNDSATQAALRRTIPCPPTPPLPGVRPNPRLSALRLFSKGRNGGIARFDHDARRTEGGRVPGVDGVDRLRGDRLVRRRPCRGLAAEAVQLAIQLPALCELRVTQPTLQ